MKLAQLGMFNGKIYLEAFQGYCAGTNSFRFSGPFTITALIESWLELHTQDSTIVSYKPLQAWQSE